MAYVYSLWKKSGIPRMAYIRSSPSKCLHRMPRLFSVFLPTTGCPRTIFKLLAWYMCWYKCLTYICSHWDSVYFVKHNRCVLPGVVPETWRRDKGWTEGDRHQARLCGHRDDNHWGVPSQEPGDYSWSLGQHSTVPHRTTTTTTGRVTHGTTTPMTGRVTHRTSENKNAFLWHSNHNILMPTNIQHH